MVFVSLSGVLLRRIVGGRGFHAGPGCVRRKRWNHGICVDATTSLQLLSHSDFGTQKDLGGQGRGDA